MKLRTEAEEHLLDCEDFRREQPSLKRWSIAHRLEGGRSLNFALFPFQPAIYRDFGDRGLRAVDVMKSGQCGISALAVSLALFAGDVWGRTTLYVLPGFSDAHDFSDTRVKTAIEDSLWLRHRVADTDNKGLKRVGDAFVYFRGSGSERQALSIPADILCLDEYDRLVQAQIPRFRKRLGAPTSLKLERRFSNPSWPEFGIHQLFLETDQREWLIRCPRCAHETRIRYDQIEDSHYVDPQRAARLCGKCRRSLTKEAIAGGRWMPLARADRRGYHVSKLIVPDEDMVALVAEHAKTAEEDVQTHYNFDLGLPYSPKGGALNRELVFACRRDYSCPDSYDGPDWVTAGVDVGKVLHVRISRWLVSGRAVPLFIGELQGFDDLARLWASYSVNFGLIDERPEERAARAFMNQFSGRVRLVRWSGEEQHDEIVPDDDQGLVVARRTWSCDQTVDAFTHQRRLLPRDLPKDYIEQVTRPHRVIGVNPASGKKFGRYDSNEQPDHYFFAETYDLLAKEVRGGMPAGGTGPAPESGGRISRLRRR